MSASQQASVSAGHIVPLQTQLAAPNGNTDPHVTLSPRTSTGLETTGFALALEQPTVLSATGPFAITVWVRDPTNQFWSAFQTVAGVGYGELYVTFDIDAAELFFQIDNSPSAAGSVYLHVTEQ